jgi:hypothetical protein
MKTTNYNIWYALLYELLRSLGEHYNSHKDWVLWKVENTLKSVDRDIEKIMKNWDEQEPPKFEVIEHEPDGSKAQELLGGAMEIKSTWRRD